jgi:cobalt-zinc-cadmium efflux system outer membrane protein
MRRVGCAVILLTAGASCATVDSNSPGSAAVKSESHSRVVAAEPSPPTTPSKVAQAPAKPQDVRAAAVVAAPRGTKPAEPEPPAVTTAAADDAPADIRTVAHQAGVPPAPAPEPSSTPAGGSSGAEAAAPGMSLQSPTAPAPAPIADGGLTVDQAVNLALSCNPTIAEAAASVRQMEAEWAQSGYYPNPIVYYVGSNLFNGQNNPGQHGVYVQQAVVTANKLNWNRAVVSGDIGDARAQLEAQRLRVQVDATLRFYEALGADRLVAISTQIRDSAERGLNAARDLLGAGQATQADVLQAEVLFNQAVVSLRQAEITAESARRQLAAVMGRADLIDVQLAGDFGAPPELDDFETAWQRLRATSPDLRSASARVARMRARIGREQAERVSDVDAQLSLQADAQTHYPVGYAQIGMALPFHHANQGAIAAAQQEFIRASREYDRRELALRSRLAATYQQIESARTAVERYQGSILPAAAENLELTRAGYSRGEFDLLRLLIAQRTFAETNIQFVNAQVQLRSAAAQTQGLLLTGGLDEPPAPQGAGGFGPISTTPKAQ